MSSKYASSGSDSNLCSRIDRAWTSLCALSPLLSIPPTMPLIRMNGAGSPIGDAPLLIESRKICVVLRVSAGNTKSVCAATWNHNTRRPDTWTSPKSRALSRRRASSDIPPFRGGVEVPEEVTILSPSSSSSMRKQKPGSRCCDRDRTAATAEMFVRFRLLTTSPIPPISARDSINRLGTKSAPRKPGRFSLLLGNAGLSQKLTYRRWPGGAGIETRYDRNACGKTHMPG